MWQIQQMARRNREDGTLAEVVVTLTDGEQTEQLTWGYSRSLNDGKTVEEIADSEAAYIAMAQREAGYVVASRNTVVTETPLEMARSVTPRGRNARR